ncbi:uncharacterized protein K460DRAFT_287338 [Cucurbitaria berberidis CBS 394.84]|uniref:RING-type domain-containing protein n=1 Tax=Cucurbitaria berberidis CBS 394.84 TaxID=1168544 RepID=A0A9P4L741_9PLEO|nr:uncharacterized protein K460DRAFT_287338 [Cucurbitaria berberidis CBS 394.84]KAF1843743.1 hypothetical protein K460DRAFT_287338 [Cucurbitaria berberidis CBS 394.84]
MPIPVGTVRHRCRAFERRIAAHQNERNNILIDRALRNADELVQQNRTYAEQLRVVECFTLLNLPPDLIDFIRDHDNLYRAAVRSHRLARTAVSSSNMDVFTRVAHRIVHLGNVYHLKLVHGTRTPAERVKIIGDIQYERVIRECTAALTDEIARILTRLEVLLPNTQIDVELENVGPDHSVDDFGREVLQQIKFFADTDADANDHAVRCCICLDGYDAKTHTGFLVAQCGHIIGKPCLSTWLNSIAKNSNLCPCCRTRLCERRHRRPKPLGHPALSAEQQDLASRLNRALGLMEDTSTLTDVMFADRVVDGQWFEDAMVELNRMLFENGVNLGFMRDGFEGLGWRLWRLDWASEMLLA